MPTTPLGDHIYRLHYSPRFALRQEVWAEHACEALSLLQAGSPYRSDDGVTFEDSAVLEALIDVTTAVTQTGNSWAEYLKEDGRWIATTEDLLVVFQLESFLVLPEPEAASPSRPLSLLASEGILLAGGCGSCGFPAVDLGRRLTHVGPDGEGISANCHFASEAWGTGGLTADGHRPIAVTRFVRRPRSIQ